MKNSISSIRGKCFKPILDAMQTQSITSRPLLPKKMKELHLCLMSWLLKAVKLLMLEASPFHLSGPLLNPRSKVMSYYKPTCKRTLRREISKMPWNKLLPFRSRQKNKWWRVVVVSTWLFMEMQCPGGMLRTRIRHEKRGMRSHSSNTRALRPCRKVLRSTIDRLFSLNKACLRQPMAPISPLVSTESVARLLLWGRRESYETIKTNSLLITKPPTPSIALLTS